MTLAGLSIKRPVATTMLMISMIFVGIVSMMTMKSELLPNMNIPVVTVTTTWTGSVPEDVETQITKEIEEILPNVEGVDKISSTSSFGQSTIVVEFDYGVDADDKVTEIQREISKISNEFPSDADNPSVDKVEAGAGNLTMVMMFSSDNKKELSTFVEQYVKPRFERISGVGEINVFGNPDKQVQIQIDTDKLASFNMSPMELYNQLSYSSSTIPLGTIETGKKNVTLRFMGELNYIDSIKDTIIKSNGNTLRLKDVADVVLTSEDDANKGFLNGTESMAVVVEKSADGSSIDINNGVLEGLEELKPIMPPNSNVKILMNTSDDINSSIAGITQSAIQALILATIVLLIFLKNMRATFLITLALPTSILFTFAFLSLSGTTINLISLMGLSLGVGMLTDNSVVVIDNIYRHMTEMKSPVKEAADDGTTEVTMSVIASSLTTMVVFIPILFIPGIAREIFRDMSFSIIFSNLSALIVSLTLMPMVASKFLKSDINITSEGKFFEKIKDKYLKLITYAVNHRIKVVLVTIATFFIVVALGGPRLKVQFMPKQDKGRYSIVAELGNGIDIKKATEVGREIENIVKVEENTKIYNTLLSGNTVAVNVDIGKKNTRKTSVFDIMDKVRPEVEKIPGVRLTLSENFAMRPPEKDVEFQLVGTDYNAIKSFGKQVADKLKKFPGAVDIGTNFDAGGPEARVVLKRDKIKAYGINPATVGQTISYAFLGGDRGDTVTVKTGIEELDVLLRLPKEKRRDINTLRNLNIKIADNKFVKVSDVADIVMAEGTSEINKTDRIYSVTISANDGGVGVAAIQQELIKDFKELNPPKSISYRWGGNAENLKDSSQQLGKSLAIAVFLIYALLAAQFENFILPFVILGSVPLALIGVVIGLLVTGESVSVMVMVGIIMLAGIVVNNAIVLIDFIKLTRERGLERGEAVIESCKTRLRPILMTTMTTVLGMLPLSLGLGEGAEVYKGMAITVMFGLAFSTLLTLVVIPITLTLVEDATDFVLKYIIKVFNFISTEITKLITSKNPRYKK
ncbi:efflux RND transporter permease subunit [Fusobacterium sp. MFO224]|uniref:efflux RND transporter permease subunit n=1 Tax=Fusobacterium sp. MFO224 TaxID=3378070 RepID=UPI00385197C9